MGHQITTRLRHAQGSYLLEVRGWMRLIDSPPCLSRGIERDCRKTAVSGETESPVCRTLPAQPVRRSSSHHSSLGLLKIEPK